MQQSFVSGFKFPLIVLVAIVLHLQSSAVQSVVIEDCGAKDADAKLTYVDIGNCGEKDPFCPFIRGTNASIEVGFKTNAPFKVAKVDIVGKFKGFKKRFEINPDDACGNYGFNCPVAPNEDKTLKLTLPVKNYYPKGLQVQVTFRLMDENKKDVFCIAFPAKITDA